MKDRTESTGTEDKERRDRGQDPSPGNDASETERGTSWISVVSGWLAALGASLIVGGILGGRSCCVEGQHKM